MTNEQRWDLRDENGDIHSPSWYLDVWMMARQEYLDALSLDTRGNTAEQDHGHLAHLDDLLRELDICEKYVNRLFNYSTE